MRVARLHEACQEGGQERRGGNTRDRRSVRELDSAGEAEQPGLRKALHLLDQRATATDEQLVREWATRTLSRAGVNPAQDHVRAVKVLRETIPGLGLRAGNDLVKSVLP
ncbi:hypothetical protein GCM10010504_56000 [Streptomyces griseus]|nr:hypothetical protein GCM10010504_56000 [Streptomyces griseus]